MIPNAFVDDAMAGLSDKALRCYLLIVRKTTGWGKEWDSISISQFQDFTGIKDDRTVRSGLLELIELGLIKSLKKTGQPTQYCLVFEPVLDGQPPTSDVPPTSHVPPTSDVGRPPTSHVPDPLHGMLPTKETNTKETNKRKEQGFLLPAFVNVVAWDEFEQHRKEIKKPLSDLARNKAANSLCDLSQEQQQKVIDYSIQGRYTGLFPDIIKKQGAGHAASGGFGKESASERNARLSEETTRQHQATVAHALANGLV